jgi:two-component system, sensor histidine kinase YesM
MPVAIKLIVFFVALFFIIVALISHIYQLKDRIAEKDDRIQELSCVNDLTQLNIHHFGNTLTWLQRQVDREGGEIIHYMNQNIETSLAKNEGYHSLRDEMIFVKNYFLTVQSIFPNTLEFEIPDDETIQKFKDVNIFYMSIQLLCENSLIHGIQQRDSPKGFIRVIITDIDNAFRIIVEDDGVGLSGKNSTDTKLDRNRGFGKYGKGTKIFEKNI